MKTLKEITMLVLLVVIAIPAVSTAASPERERPRDRERDVEVEVEIDGDKVLRHARESDRIVPHGPGREKKAGYTEYRAGAKPRSEKRRDSEMSREKRAILKKIHELEIQQMELGIKHREVRMFIQRTEDKKNIKDLEAELDVIEIEKERLKIEQVRQQQRLETLELSKSEEGSRFLAQQKRIHAIEIQRLELKNKAKEVQQMINRSDKDAKTDLLQELEKIQLEYERLNIDKRRQQQLIEQAEFIESEDVVRDFELIKSKTRSHPVRGVAIREMEIEDEDLDPFDVGDKRWGEEELELDERDLKQLKKDCPNLIKLYEMMLTELEGIDEDAEDAEYLFDEMRELEEGMHDLLMTREHEPKMYELEAKATDLEALSEILSVEIHQAKERKKGSEKKLVDKLRKLLNEEFEARESLRRHEADMIAVELEEIKSLLKKRRENKDKIIEYRILELTKGRDELLEW